MLTDKEVVLATVWNGRMAALQDAGVPAAVSWPQGLLKRDCWAVPKGTPNKLNAMKFIGFGTMAISQARLSVLIPYGFVNNQSAQYHSAGATCRAAERAADPVAAVPTTTAGGSTTATR